MINRVLPDVAIEPVKVAPDTIRVDLPRAPGADYRFCLWYYADGERQIHAEPVDAEFGAAGTFWYHAFEHADYGSRLNDEFDAELMRLLKHDTRVRQRRGWLSWRFSLELARGGAWELVSTLATARGAIAVPKIHGRERIYSSRALVL